MGGKQTHEDHDKDKQKPKKKDLTSQISTSLYENQVESIRNLWAEFFGIKEDQNLSLELFLTLFDVDVLNGFHERLFRATARIDLLEGGGGDVSFSQFVRMVEYCLKNMNMNFFFLLYCDSEGVLERGCFIDIMADMYYCSWYIKLAQSPGQGEDYAYERTRFLEVLSDAICNSMFGENASIQQDEFVTYMTHNLPNFTSGLTQYIEGIVYGFDEEKETNQSSEISDDSDPEIKSKRTFFPPTIQDVELSGYRQVKYEIPWILDSIVNTKVDSWSLLYSYGRDGVSFNRFCAQVVEYGGPTLILIRDKGAHLFGIYSSKPWKSSSKYRQDEDSFLFLLKPTFKVLRTVKNSSEHLYLYNNTGSNSQFPIGFGAGGHLRDFRLWIDESLKEGRSRAFDDSYSTGQLTGDSEFKIVKFEVWGCGGQDAEEMKAKYENRRAIEISKRKKIGASGVHWSENETDQTILEMAGITLHGKVYREEINEAIKEKEKKQSEEKEKKQSED